MDQLKHTLTPLYDFFYTDVALQRVGIVVGIGLLILHLLGLVLQKRVEGPLREFPRNKSWGVALLAFATAWAFLVISVMDLGEFYPIRKFIQIILPVGFVLVCYYVDEFLAVRALGVLMLLIPTPILTAALLEPPVTRLLLPVVSYVWIIVGMYFIGMPWLMRDWIGWIQKEPRRWQIACIGGIAYGAAVLICAFLFWGE